MALAERTGKTQKEVAALLETSRRCLVDRLQQGEVFAMQGFGSLEVRRLKERRLINPATHATMVIPPKCSVTFKSGVAYKEKLKQMNHDGK